MIINNKILLSTRVEFLYGHLQIIKFSAMSFGIYGQILTIFSPNCPRLDIKMIFLQKNTSMSLSSFKTSRLSLLASDYNVTYQMITRSPSPISPSYSSPFRCLSCIPSLVVLPLLSVLHIPFLSMKPWFKNHLLSVP